MAINTYATLVAAASDWLNRADLAGRIPDFITLAEAKFNRDLRVNQMEKRSTTAVNMSNSEPEFIAVPTDFQTMRRIRLSSVTGKPRLEPMSGAQADEYRAGWANIAMQPTHFTIFGDEIELLPTPDQAYTIEMVYRSYLSGLTASNTTNWLLTLAPDLYLYGTLLEAAPYVPEDERLAVWVSGMQSALDGLNRLSQAQIYGSGPLQMRLSGVVP